VLKDVNGISAGYAHGLALKQTVQLYAGATTSMDKAIFLPRSKVVILKDGSVAAWGSNAANQAKPPSTLKNVRHVAAGLDHSLALKTDGTVVAWGNNTYGQAAVPSNANDVKQISAGTQFSMAVRNDGTVLAWGRNDYNQIIIPAEYKDVYSAFAGYANTILGLRNGRVVVLGSQTDGVGVSRTPTKTATPTP
jgi:alpha-tubulin suppressor-like RCC1 family protein